MGNEVQDLIWAYREANPALSWRELIRYISERERVPEAQVEKCLLLKLRAEAGLQIVM